MWAFWFVFSLWIGIELYFIACIAFTLYNKILHRGVYADAAFTSQPPHRPDWLPRDAFLLSLHTHTLAFEGFLSPEQLVRWHIANGYNGFVVTDHNTCSAIPAIELAARKIDPNFLVIPGVEYSTWRIHLNLIGIRKFPWSKLIIWPGNRGIRKVIEKVHTMGGLVQFNHRGWYNNPGVPTNEQLYAWGVDGIEVYNGFGFYDRAEEIFIKRINSKSLANRPVYASAGVDLHNPEKLWRVYTEVLTSDRTVQGVLQALREGRTHVWAHPTDPAEKGRPIPERDFRRVSPDYIRFSRKWRIFTRWGEQMLRKIDFGS